jgi:hypothetical protein
LRQAASLAEFAQAGPDVVRNAGGRARNRLAASVPRRWGYLQGSATVMVRSGCCRNPGHAKSWTGTCECCDCWRLAALRLSCRHLVRALVVRRWTGDPAMRACSHGGKRKQPRNLVYRCECVPHSSTAETQDVTVTSRTCATTMHK